MTLNEAFNEFILDKRLRGLSSQTIIDYSNIVSIFLRYVGPELALEELTRPMVITLFCRQ